MKQFTKVISAAIISLQMLSQAALADAGTFQQIITRQIEAFRAGDGSTAFGFAAPQLQMLFQTQLVEWQNLKQYIHNHLKAQMMVSSVLVTVQSLI